MSENSVLFYNCYLLWVKNDSSPEMERIFQKGKRNSSSL